MVAKALAALALLALASCVTSKGSFCDIARPIRMSAATIDAMTDDEVKQALALNKKGEKLCHWRA